MGNSHEKWGALEVDEKQERIEELEAKLKIAVEALKRIAKFCGHTNRCYGKDLIYCDAGCEFGTDAAQALVNIEGVK